ncbi:hypothetical protein AB0H73_08910 [Streptomyces olivoreticuli]
MRKSARWVIVRFKRLPWYGKLIALAVAAAAGYFLAQFIIVLVIDLVAFAVTMIAMILVPVFGFLALAGAGKRGSRRADDAWYEENDPRQNERTHAGDLPHF